MERLNMSLNIEKSKYYIKLATLANRHANRRNKTEGRYRMNYSTRMRLSIETLMMESQPVELMKKKQ